MNNILGEIPSEFQLGEILICATSIMTQVELFQTGLCSGETLNLEGLIAVAFLFMIEELGPFRGIVDNL